jgi:hypothetical protein
LRTGGAVEANVTQAETYQSSDSSGNCHHREITASGGYVTSDESGLPCVPALPVGDPPGAVNPNPGDGGNSSAPAKSATASGALEWLTLVPLIALGLARRLRALS